MVIFFIPVVTYLIIIVMSLLIDLTTHSSTALVFHAMATYSLDTAKNFAGEILPLVFLTMHAKPREEDDSKCFSNNTSGRRQQNQLQIIRVKKCSCLINYL